MAKPIYRYSFLGEAFIETMNQLQVKFPIDEDVIESLLEKFDEVYKDI